MEHGQRNEPREPEQHRQGIEAQDDPFVGEAWEPTRSEEEKRSEEKGPDGAEEEEVDLGRGVSVERVGAIPVTDYQRGKLA